MDYRSAAHAPSTPAELQEAYQELTTFEEELRRQAEELEDAHRQIEREHSRYQPLFDEAPDGYILTDRFGRIRELNGAALAILGRNRGQTVGKPIFVMFQVDERNGPRQALNAITTDPRERTFTAMLHSTTGEIHPFEVRVSMAHHESYNDARDGATIRWILRDLTTLQRAVEAEREADVLRRSNHAKDELLGLVSHELRTPLTIIIGASRALSRVSASGDGASHGELVTDIADSAERLRGIVDNMLALARVEQEGELTLEPLLLQRFLPGTLDREREVHGGQTFDVHVDSDLPPVMAAPMFVDQIVQNLISNAIKYGEEGSPIGVAAHADGQAVAVTISNSGAPVQIDFDRLFQPFYRSKATAARVSGAGLGLSACRRLLAAQGGTIQAAAREEGGLDVTFRLRVCEFDDA